MSDIQNKIEALRKAVADIHTKMMGPPPHPPGCCTIKFGQHIIPIGILYPEECAEEGGTFHGHGVECDEVPGVVNPNVDPKPKPKPRPRPGLPFRN